VFVYAPNMARRGLIAAGHLESTPQASGLPPAEQPVPLIEADQPEHGALRLTFDYLHLAAVIEQPPVEVD
jgi:hypothetical protein